MNLLEVKRIFERRRYNLINTLEDGREELDLSKQHQMYGAIQELENVMKTIDYYHSKASEKRLDFHLEKEPEATMIEKMTLRFKRKNNK